MKRLILFTGIVMLGPQAWAQCPKVFDFFGFPSSHPYWYSCSGTDYTLNLTASVGWDDYTINWGDGTNMTTGGTWNSGQSIAHFYPETIDTFVVTITEPSSGCIVTGVLVMEEATAASIQIPAGIATQGCAPIAMTFQNSSTSVSGTTVFEWDFGDGTPHLILDASNSGQTVQHTYDPGTVNCMTSVQLQASNYCNVIQNNASVALFSPINIWDVDQATIGVDEETKCFPTTSFEFVNNSNKNCFNQGNIFQRQEQWNFGNYWSGIDSTTTWVPFPPSPTHTVTFPGMGDFTVTMLDSNFCGIDTATKTIHIVPAPEAHFSFLQDTVCVNTPVTFFQQYTGNANIFAWAIDGTWTNTGSGNFNYTFNAPGIYEVKSRVSMSASPTTCADTLTQSIVVLPAPSSHITASQTIGCDSITVQLNGPINQNATYEWTLGNPSNLFNGQNPPTQVFTQIGDYTIHLHVEALNGCASNDDVIIQVITTPVANFSWTGQCINTPIQFTNTSSAGAASFNWNIDNVMNTQENPVYSFSQTGDFPVTIIAGVGACSDTITHVVTIHETPTAAFSPSVLTGCSPLLVSFDNQSMNAITYNWTLGDGNVTNAADTSNLYTAPLGQSMDYTVVLTATSSHGCQSTADTLIHVTSGAEANFIEQNPVPECSPHLAVFQNTSLNSTGYSWDFGDGVSSNEYQPSHVYVNLTNQVQFFHAQLIALSPTCNDTIQKTVVVFPSPQLDLDFSSFSGCGPIQMTMPLLPNMASYLWDFGDGTSSTLATPSHVFSASSSGVSNYTVTFTGVSVFGCNATGTTQLMVAQKPNAQAASNITSGCEPLEITFTNSSTLASSYQWIYGDGTESNTLSDSHLHVFEDNGNIELIYPTLLIATADNGCTDTTQINISMHPRAHAVFSPSNGDCAPFQSVMTNTSTAANQFNWNFGDGTSSTGLQPSHVYENSILVDTSYQITLIASNNFNCSDTTTQLIQVNHTPLSQFEFSDTTGCYPLIVQMHNTSLGADHYYWDYGNGLNSTNDQVFHEHNFFNLSQIPVTQTVVLQAISSQGCSGSSFHTITIPAGLTANFTLDAEGCHPHTTGLLNQSIGAIEYDWDFGDGMFSIEPSPTHTFFNGTNNDTTFVVTLIATNAFGCQVQYQQVVHVFPVPIASIAVSNTNPIWPEAVDFENNSVVGNSTNFVWDMGDGSVLNVNAPVQYEYDTWNTYPVIMVASNGQCSDTAFLQMNVIAPPPVAAFGGDTAGCAPLTVIFTDSTLFTQGWLWDFGDGGASIASGPVHTYQIPGTYDVKLIAIGYNNQFDTLVHELAVHVYPAAQAAFSVNVDQVTVPSQPVNMINLSSNATEYYWDFHDGTTSPLFNPSHTYQEAGIYDITLMVNNEFGCADSLTLYAAVVAKVGGSLTFPNAFTPVASGPSGGQVDALSLDNDVFFPKFEGVKDYQLLIYNKWGELLFESHDVKKGWDGYYRDQLCPQDVYIWKAVAIFNNGDNYTETGEVHLIRK